MKYVFDIKAVVTASWVELFNALDNSYPNYETLSAYVIYIYADVLNETVEGIYPDSSSIHGKPGTSDLGMGWLRVPNVRVRRLAYYLLFARSY